MTTAARIDTTEPALFSFVHGIAPPPGPRQWSAYLSEHGKSFWMAAQLIPQPFRTQLAGVYAYCRYTDDLVDRAQCASGDLVRVLDEWEGLSRAAYAGRETGVALLDVVVGEMAQRGVPFAYIEGMLRGMRTDVSGVRFDSVAQLEGYCHDVASVVGLWLTELFGVHDRWTLDRAARLGVALQLTNIARDVGEDWDRGRLYLPQSMLDAHGVTGRMIGTLRNGTAPLPASYAALLEELMTMADVHYTEAELAFGNLPAFFRSSVAVAARVYRGIHDVIRANGYDSLRRRAATSEGRKVALARDALAALASSAAAI
jgi:phytoene synthase